MNKGLRIQRLHASPGYVPGMNSAHLQVWLKFEGTAITEREKNRIDRFFLECKPDENLQAKKSGDFLTNRLLSCISSELKNRDFPDFYTPAVKKLETNVFFVALPIFIEKLSALQAIFPQLVQLMNAVLNDTESQKKHPDYRQLFDQLGTPGLIGDNSLLILQECERRNIPWFRHSNHIFQIGHGVKSRLMKSSITDQTTALAVELARNKLESTALLRVAGLPVAQNQYVSNLEDAVRVAEKIGYPVVIKPVSRERGEAVTADIRTEKELREICKRFPKGYSMMLEKHFTGKDYRLYVLDNKAFLAIHRIPYGVTGDGVSTIAELLKHVETPFQKTQSDQDKALLENEVLRMLKQNNLDTSSIPEKNHFIPLRSIANLSSGGQYELVETDDIHPDNLRLAESALRLLRLDFGGVDLLTPDISKPWYETGACICEVNSQPQFGDRVLRYLFDHFFTDQGRIPIIALVGIDSPEEFIEGLKQSPQFIDQNIGFITPNYCLIDNNRLFSSNENIFNKFNALLRHPNTTAIVAIVDEQVLNTGFPVNHIDALVLGKSVNTDKNKMLTQGLSLLSKSIYAISDDVDTLKAQSEIQNKTAYLLPSVQLQDRIEEIIKES